MTHNTALRRHGSIEPKGRGVIVPGYHPAVRDSRSIFSSRVFAPDEVQRCLKTGQQSRKIGAVVAKGPHRGWPIFTLTLEERATCPRSCSQWQHCFGNNMQAAERIQHGDDLTAALTFELHELARQHPAGFMVRLHVLGDFYSAEYAEFWHDMLRALPALHIFGFTAHAPDSPTGLIITGMAQDFGWERAAIRFSGASGRLHAARVLEVGEQDPDAILCPAQTGTADCCATCMLCIHSPRSIAFRRH